MARRNLLTFLQGHHEEKGADGKTWFFAATSEDKRLAGRAVKEWARPSQDDRYWRVSEEYRGGGNRGVLSFLVTENPRYYLRKCEAEGDHLVLSSRDGDYPSVQDAQEAAQLKDIGKDSQIVHGEVLPASDSVHE